MTGCKFKNVLWQFYALAHKPAGNLNMYMGLYGFLSSIQQRPVGTHAYKLGTFLYTIDPFLLKSIRIIIGHTGILYNYIPKRFPTILFIVSDVTESYYAGPKR